VKNTAAENTAAENYAAEKIRTPARVTGTMETKEHTKMWVAVVVLAHRMY
jgi:hypothetical protein